MEPIEYIAKQNWVTSKDKSHQYVVRDRNDDIDFIDFVNIIRKNGTTKSFYGKKYKYFYVDNYKYWTMGAPIEETIIINREELK